MSELLERTVTQQLNTYLQSSGLLPSLQSGFRSGHSTETAVLWVLSDLLQAVDSGDVTALVLFEIRCYRRILAVKWQDRITNEEIRAVVQRKETVVDTIGMRKLQLFGHICRMPDDRLLKTFNLNGRG